VCGSGEVKHLRSSDNEGRKWENGLNFRGVRDVHCLRPMKTTLLLFALTVSIAAARAQEATCPTCQQEGYPVPAVVYEAPVVYAAPVVYQAPVVYYGPVFYGTPAGYALNACWQAENNAALSTVTYIGGGNVSYQTAPRCNNGSTVVFIGGQSRFR
jgi:hypothetical protein